jgi:quinoprotein glucose dehydrogenase
VLAENVAALVRIDGTLLDAALALVKEYEIDFNSVPTDALRALVVNSGLPGIARVDALELYAARKPADLSTVVRQLAVGGDDACAIAALRMLAKSDPQAALASAEKAIKAPGAWRQQQAWRIVGGIDLPGAADLIASGLDGLSKTKGVSPAALELLDCAAQRKEPVVQTALAAFQSAQTASTDPLAKWLTLLEGGDSARGGELFGSHPAGQCMRCHAVGHGGGDAGPDLSDDSAGTPMRAARADIQSMTPPVSAMPPMGLILQPGEIRDIVAWLAEQKAKPRKKPKRPKPVLVK